MVEFNVINGCFTSIVLDLLPENLPLRQCSILSDCNLLTRMVDSLNKALSILLTSPNIRLSFIVQRVRQGIENNKAESYVRLTRLTSNIDKGKGHVFNYQEPDVARKTFR